MEGGQVTYGEKYERLLTTIEHEVSVARDLSRSGDLWESMAHLDYLVQATEEARQLLLDVSKAAFARVMQSREGSR